MKNWMISIIVLAIFVFLCGLSGCGLFSSTAGDVELVFAATEVGTPEGEKVTKEIGPAGGTLTSPAARRVLVHRNTCWAAPEATQWKVRIQRIRG